MKVAFCFFLHGEKPIIQKEAMWRDWFEDVSFSNIYIHHDNTNKDTKESEWIKNHKIPKQYTMRTSYFHMVEAYMSTMLYAMRDKENEWFVFLTGSCAPLVSPEYFRIMFLRYSEKSILQWGLPSWDIRFHRRANLAHLHPELRLQNDPWFILCRKDVKHCLRYRSVNKNIYVFILQGGLANESIFAIMLHWSKTLSDVINCQTHATDWTRMTSKTSPHVFYENNAMDRSFIERTKRFNPFAFFIRKVHSNFPLVIKNCQQDTNTA
jgi:hypothetical protein